MKQKVSVTVDEEIAEKFKGKANFWYAVRFEPGVVIRIVDSVWCYSSPDLGLSVFKVAEGGGSSCESQYDEEFTEWLKEHRPEVFL